MFGSVLNVDKVKLAGSKYPKDPKHSFTYGTAGFRMSNELLDSVMFRMGLLAVLRSKSLGGKVIGVMMTASHNPEIDNGVKLVEPMGEMLVAEWEVYATQLANANNDALVPLFSKLASQLKVDLASKSTVIFARDTRPSGPRLVRALADGIKSLDSDFTDFGELSTPELHYLVRALNTKGTKEAYGEPTEEGYFDKLTKAYTSIVEGKKTPTLLHVDCANGVGALKLKKFIDKLGNGLPIEMVNIDIRTAGTLNYKCGADFVKVDQKIPSGITEAQAKGRCCSLDGDADRLVYYYVNESGSFVLLDGDKIAALSAGYLNELIQSVSTLKGKIEIGVVQTAYANGNSTRYFINQGIPVACTETGVKHLHHRAEEFDIGVYFEANGHGTVLFKPQVIQMIRSVDRTSVEENQALTALQGFTEVINQAVGDAISDMLMVEAILVSRQWTLTNWASMYSDLPNRQLKVRVANRAAFKTADADRVLVEPAGLQDIISSHVSKVTLGRAFVRPSGTEDVVRIYAEAETQGDCDHLAFTLATEVYDRAGGVGDRPKPI